MVDAPSIQSFEVKIDKLWKNHPIKNYFTPPPLLWTVSPLNTCAQSQNNAQDRAGTKKRECLIQARKGPVRTCKNCNIARIVFCVSQDLMYISILEQIDNKLSILYDDFSI